MSSSMSHFDQRVPLRHICASLLAWYAVLFRIPQEDFLKWRKRVYEALYRRSHYPLPSDIVIEHGEVNQVKPAQHLLYASGALS